MSNPLTKAAAPAPDLFRWDVSSWLSGPVDWKAQLPLISAWALSTGLAIALIVVLTVVGLRAYGLGVDHVHRLISENIKPGAAVRMTQRTSTLTGILRSLGRAVILFIGFTLLLSKVGVNIAPLLASAGIVGLAVGFGAQSLVKDVISGFFILMEDQYGVGDVISIDGKSGEVERMNLRITQLRNLDGQLITIPNGTIQAVTNMSKEWSRAVLDIGVAYQEEPDRVMAVLASVGSELRSEMPDDILEPIEVLGVDAFKESEVTIKVVLKTRPLRQWAVARAFRRKVWYRFREEKIEIPFPQRTLWLAAAGEQKQAELVLRTKESEH